MERAAAMGTGKGPVWALGWVLASALERASALATESARMSAQALVPAKALAWAGGWGQEKA